MLQNLARYVYETGNVFSPGHSMDLFGPIREGSDTAIRAAMFYNDPELEDFLGPFGHVRFLQIVGITEDERAAIRTWDATAVAPILSEHLPLLVTDLGRRSLLSHPEVDRAIVEGRTKNGSSLGALRISTLSVRAERRFPRRPAMVTLPATVVDSLCLLLPLRIPFGRAFMLTGAKESLTVFAGAFYTLMKTPEGGTSASPTIRLRPSRPRSGRSPGPTRCRDCPSWCSGWSARPSVTSRATSPVTSAEPARWPARSGCRHRGRGCPGTGCSHVPKRLM